MLTLIEQVLIFLIFAAAGYILSKTKMITPEKSGILSRIILFLFLPSTIIKSLAENFTVEKIRAEYQIILVATIILVILLAVCFTVFKFIKMRQFTKNIFIYALVVPNYGYMGYALAEAIFGAQIEYYVILFCLPLSIFTYTIGYCMLTSDDEDGFKITWNRFINPVFISTLIGIALGLLNLKLPEFIMDLLSKSAACTGPVSMILVGAVVAEFKFFELFKDWKAYIIVAFRNLIIPIAACFILKSIKAAELSLVPAIATLAMPCGSNTIVFSKLKGESSEPAASIVIISTLLSLITVPFCLYLTGTTIV